MPKHRLTQVLTVLILLAAVSFGVARKSAGEPSQEPQSAVYAMLNAERAGDVKLYLASHTGPMQATLRQMLAETTQPAFAKYLRESLGDIKGVAVSDPQITGHTATVRVEYVYQDRDESQLMYLQESPQGWKISRIANDERTATPLPYGTRLK